MIDYTNTGGKLRITNPFGAGIVNPNILYAANTIPGRAALLTQLALQDTDGLARILAEPRLVLQSGKTATVSLNTDKYYITPGVNVSGDIKPLPTGVSFEVSPVVLGDRKVLLHLKISQSEFVTNTETGVAAVVNKNTIDTSIVADDGELISLGGILTRKDIQLSAGMTGVRKIPVLGRLFGSNDDSSVASRVEFFIRPTINRSHEKTEEIARDSHDTNCKLESRLGGDTCSPTVDNIVIEELK
jgi:general secretion pathway protein D